MKFSQLKKGNIIARVEGYKVEGARVISNEKTGAETYKLIVRGIETKRKYTLKVNGKHCTMCGFGGNGPERYYADGSLITALRDGIEIGFAEARRQVTESFKTVYPYFTVGGRPVKD